MSWRNILISNPAKLRCENNSLIIEQDCKYHVPLEDISSIVIDCPQVIMTQPVLSFCADRGIAIYTTNIKHIPNGVFLSFSTHSKATKLLKSQLSVSKPLQKRIWSQLVNRKILNQAICLELSSLQEEADYMKQLATKIRSGDPDNIEARAAAYYFKNLFNVSFSRNDEENMINGCLNYGYSIIRGEIARRLVAHGLDTHIGLFHNNLGNSFNLADDLIEPYRAVVDLFTKQYIESSYDERLPKSQLIELLYNEVSTPKGNMSVSQSIEILVESYVRILDGKTDQLDLPVLKVLAKHLYEDILLP